MTRSPRVHATRLAGIAAALFVLVGCTKQLPPLLVPNERPTVRLTQASIDTTSENFYSVTLNWVGYDPDGRVDHYLYAIDPPEHANQDTTWTSTAENEKRFTFSASTQALGADADSRSRDFHTFVIAAVDDRGQTGVPVYRSFFTYTVAPTVSILSPTPSKLTNRTLPPSVRITWAGQDVDGVFSSRPVRYRYRLFRAGEALPFALDSALSDPTILRNAYAPKFSAEDGWVETRGDSTTAQFTNLTPELQYLFVVVPFDEAGAYSPVFSLDNNMLRFKVSYGASRGPKICIFNEYFFYCSTGGYPTPPAGERRLEVPEHQPITFRWTAETSPGAEIRCFRWMLDGDVFDPDSREDELTDTRHWSACSRNMSATIGPFDVTRDGPDHYFYLEAEDTNHLKSLVTVHMSVVHASLDLPLLVVSDTRLNPLRLLSNGCYRPPTGRWPTAAELDTFLFARGHAPLPCPYPEEARTDPGLFDGYAFNVENTKYGRQDLRMPLSVIGRYRHVVWIVDGTSARMARLGTDPNEPLTSLRYMSANNQVNTLAAYVKLGGLVWLAGGGGAYANLIPNNDPGNDHPRETFSSITGQPQYRELAPGRMMYDLAKWQSEIQIANAPSYPVRNLGRFRSRPGLYAALPDSMQAKTPATDQLPPLRNPSDFYVRNFDFEFLTQENVILEPIQTDPVDFVIDTFNDNDPSGVRRRWISSDTLNTLVSQDPVGQTGRAMLIATQGGGASVGDRVSRTFNPPRDWSGLSSLRFAIKQSQPASALQWRVRIVDARGGSLAALVPVTSAGAYQQMDIRLGQFATDSPTQPNLVAVSRLELEAVTAEAAATTSIDQVAIAMTFDAPVLDTLYSARGGASTSMPEPNAIMTYYHGHDSPPFVFTGFSLWMYRRADCQRLIDFVLQRVWGLDKEDRAAARARINGPSRAAAVPGPRRGASRR